jgi:uncharacterized protein (TIGR02757 family)
MNIFVPTNQIKMSELSTAELKLFLEEKVLQFNTKSFITDDPIQIPYNYSSKEDIEISAFLSCTIAWGNRTMIIKNGYRMMELLDESPYDFIVNHSESDLTALRKFVHRTFNGEDFIFFVRSLKNIYTNKGGMEEVFKSNQGENSLLPAIAQFHKIFFEPSHDKRTEKHVADPNKGSVAKRINLFLRWMIRKDGIVDFGLWDIPTSKLHCPLDVHSGNIARKLGIISRKNNDLAALEELDQNLRALDDQDPVKYDFALFGLGVYDQF